mgnify:CR=1 FL=1
MSDSGLTLYFAPRTRSFTALWLLEELGVSYDLESFDINTGRHKQPDFLALNPMGKVPLAVHDGVPISELGAITIYLADRFAARGLAPALDDPDRPAYLRWIFFASAIIEPAYMCKATQWEVPAATAAWGSYDGMVEVLRDGLKQGPWILGDRMTAADIQLGSVVRFGQNFGLLSSEGVLGEYVARVCELESFARAMAIEERESARFPPKK